MTVRVEASTRRVRPLHKTYWLTGGFLPDRIVVTRGQQVTVEFVSREGTHSLAIPAYHVQSGPVPSGETTSVTFLADRVGEFEIRCQTSCGPHHLRMTGTLVVEEP
ncbi:MAG: hypothetical protein AB1758_29840 [Candidatus Eremiobacterota bacterium]